MSLKDEHDGDGQKSELSTLEQRLDSLWRNELPTGDRGGHSIAGYRVIDVLGRGAFGIVYLAEARETGAKVALKIPRPEVLVDTDRRKRFSDEASLAAKLSHPGIVEVLETETSGPTPYIAAAFCNGPNLAEWLENSSKPAAWEDSVRLMAQIVTAVGYAHSKGISHRDLKPANIMLVNSSPDELDAESLGDYEPKVTDFGLAKLSDPTLTDTRSSLLVGTPSYMAPEQLEGGGRTEHAIATDIYSLGVMLFELLTKELPISGNSYFEVLDNIRTTAPIGLRTIRKDVPRSLAKICMTCLRKNPQARYETAEALAKDLRNCLQGKAVVGKSTNLIKSSIYWCTHPNRLKTAGAFTFGCQTLTLFWFYFSTASLCLFKVVTAEQYFQIMFQDAMIILASSSLMCWAGWMALNGRRIGIYVAMVMTILILPLSILPLFYEPVLFKTVYADQQPYFSFVIHMVPATGFTVQAFLLVCAIISMRPQAKRIAYFSRLVCRETE